MPKRKRTNNHHYATRKYKRKTPTQSTCWCTECRGTKKPRAARTIREHHQKNGQIPFSERFDLERAQQLLVHGAADGVSDGEGGWGGVDWSDNENFHGPDAGGPPGPRDIHIRRTSKPLSKVSARARAV